MIISSVQENTEHNTLEFIHDHHIRWQGNSGVFSVLGHLSMDISTLRVTLHIEREAKRKQRLKLDLYDYDYVSRLCKHLSEDEGFVFREIENDLLTLTGLLESHREMLFKEAYQSERKVIRRGLSLEKEKEFTARLSNPSLLADMSKVLGKIGIAGEVNNRLLLFIIGTSYKHRPLHAVIQSSSGAGKSHLINTIADCFPKEDVLSLSRITSKSLYHYKSEMLDRKLVLIQDFDGLDDEALFAFRELQSYGKLTTSLTGKDAFGHHRARLHTVEGHFTSFGATTKELYTDNTSRSILLKLDESEEQTQRIASYTTPKQEEIEKTKQEIQNMMRLLKPEHIVNPFKEQIHIQANVPMARRLNDQLRQFIEQLTFLHQYQRERNEHGSIITAKEDVEKGIELFMDALWIKVDELPIGTRDFFERLKGYIKSLKGEEQTKEFTQRDIRLRLSMSRSALHRHIKTLLEMEYLEIVSGSSNKGYRYAISYMDNEQNLRHGLMKQLLDKS